MKKSFGIILSSVLFLLFSCGIEKRGEKASTPEVDSGLRVSLIEIQQIASGMQQEVNQLMNTGQILPKEMAQYMGNTPVQG